MSDTPTESTGHTPGKHEQPVDQRAEDSTPDAEYGATGEARGAPEGADPHAGGANAEATAEGTGGPADDPQALRAQLAVKDEEIAKLKDGLLRARAEFENAEKRLNREVENARKYALERFVEELLPVVDSLELGIRAANEADADIAKLREGNEMTLRLFQQVFERFQVEVVDPHGERFDPERHEAMSAQPSNEYPPNTVISVMQKGYLLTNVWCARPWS